MKNLDYYTQVQPIKSKNDVREEIFEEHEFENFIGTAKQIETKREDLQIVADNAYAMHLKNRRQEKVDKRDEFKNDLLIYHGVNHHPKGEYCFDLAWDFGHSEGLHNVQHFFERFVILIKN